MAAKDPALLTLGKNLRRAREAKGWSQEEMAFKSGVHRTYVGGVERGEYNASILTIRRFTRALGIALTEAIRGIR